MTEAEAVYRYESGYISHSAKTDYGPLDFTGRIAGGLRLDIRRRAPLFCSDWTDAFLPENFQKSVSSILYLFIAALAPAITFGSRFLDGTNGQFGVLEMIMSTSISGLIFSTFAGQPLSILGATGPFLAYTLVVYDLAIAVDIEFMPFYFWTCMWCSVFTILVAVFDLCALMKHASSSSSTGLAICGLGAAVGAAIAAPKKERAALRAFENELGVQAPVGFWDPAGFTSDGDAKDFYRRRVVEIKHGRVSMLACTGYIVQEFVRFPGFLSPSSDIKFADIPNGLKAVTVVPAVGWFQYTVFCGLCDLWIADQRPSNPPGKLQTRLFGDTALNYDYGFLGIPAYLGGKPVEDPEFLGESSLGCCFFRCCEVHGISTDAMWIEQVMRDLDMVRSPTRPPLTIGLPPGRVLGAKTFVNFLPALPLRVLCRRWDAIEEGL
ncbi:FCPF [Symbiodinium sp. CCMP2456]|nr:FCPF [Symbiodinium sp. CCMP2456]